jgi:serine/threonine protein kinase
MRPRFCIALEFCELGSLLHVLERQDIFWEWDKTFDLIRQVIQAVNDLHTWNPQIVHRDLKSLNLLIDKDFNVKVCDFGLARQTEVTEDADGQINTLSTLNKLRGTYGYSAPELYEKQKATNKSDVFSLGIILWEIVSRVITGVYARPYAEYTNMRYDFQVLIGVSKKGIRPTLPATCPEEFKMMITSCWSGQAEKRPDCGFLLIQLNMIKGREYNKNKQQWDALLPPRPPGAITPGISSASSTAVPTVPEKNGNSGPESAATAKSAPATTSSTPTATSSPPAKASSPAPAPAQVPAPAVATTRKTRTSADKDGKEEKKEKKKKSSRKKEKKASSTTTEEGEKKKKKSSKKKEKTDKDTTAGEKEKKKKKKTTTKSDE